jgi:hypothetical protein
MCDGFEDENSTLSDGGKSDMRSERVDEILLTNYLVGKLSEEEAVQVEDRAFEDAAYLGEMEAAEADLIDAYVRGDLRGSDRREFERRFLTSPGRRGKVEFAVALARAMAEMRPSESIAVRSSFRQTLAAAFGAWRLSFQFAAAAALVLFALGTWWLARENASIRFRASSLEARNRELESRLAQTGRASGDRLQADAQKQSPATAAVPSLMLLPGLPRAATREKRLEISPGAQIAHIEIQLEARDNYPHFRAEIRTRGGLEVLSRGNLVRRRTGEAYAVDFDVPASALAPNEYELALSGVDPGKTAEKLAFYYFAVVRGR